MSDFEVKDSGNNDYVVTNKDTGEVYDVHLNHYGNHSATKRDGEGGGGLPILIFLPLLVVAMPIIFFIEKLWSDGPSCMIFIVAYIVCVIAFIFVFFPSVKDKKISPKLKLWAQKAFSIIMYLFLIFCGVFYFTQGLEKSARLFSYIMPLVTYGLILYHVKDFHLIPIMMEALKIKKWSFTVVYILQWLAICLIFYYGIMNFFGDILGEFLMFVICYMYIILVDVKKFILLKKYRYLFK